MSVEKLTVASIAVTALCFGGRMTYRILMIGCLLALIGVASNTYEAMIHLNNFLGARI